MAAILVDDFKCIFLNQNDRMSSSLTHICGPQSSANNAKFTCVGAVCHFSQRWPDNEARTTWCHEGSNTMTVENSQYGERLIDGWQPSSPFRAAMNIRYWNTGAEVGADYTFWGTGLREISLSLCEKAYVNYTNLFECPRRLCIWWRYQTEKFSALLAICAGKSTVPGEFPLHGPVTRSFDVFFGLCPNKRLSKQ